MRLRAMLATAVLGLTLVATGQAAVIRIATVAPEGSDWMRQMRAGAIEIKKRTEGRVTIKFFGGGVMGSDKKVLRKIRLGQLQGGVFVSSALAEQYNNMNLYGMPFLFNSQDEVDYVRERVDERLLAGLYEAGFVSFGVAGGGFAMLMANVPVRSMQDLENQKVWVPEGDITSYAAMEALGLAPVILPITDVLTGLQTGLIDIIASSAVAAVVLQWHTKVKYITDLPVSYLSATLVVDRRTFDGLSEADQAVVRDVMSTIYRGFDSTSRKDNVEAAEALTGSGLEYVLPDAVEAEGWRATVRAANLEMAQQDIVSAGLLDEVLGYLGELRGESSSHARADE